MAGLAVAPRRKNVPPGSTMVMSSAKGTAGAGLALPPRPGYTPPPPPAWGGGVPSLPTNPTAVSMPGQGTTQQTDQMGRVITSQAPSYAPGIGADGMWSDRGVGGPGFTQIEDPDQVRRTRDLADEQTRLSMRPPTATPGPAEDGEEDLRKYFDYIKNQFQTPAREGPITAPPRVTGEPEADRRQAEAAEFGRAKDRVARIARGAGKSLEADMVGRNLVGSGIEARNMRDIVRGGQGDLASVATEQALASLKRRNDVADRNYGGDISQRNADIGVASTNLGSGVTQRGQDINAQQNLLQMVPSLAALSRRRVVLR